MAEFPANNVLKDAAAKISELQLRFPRNEALLFDGVTVEIPQGQNVLLLGPSGSGKSTLLKLLTGLMPETIEVPVDWSERRCFDSWGYVFQDPDAQFCMPYVDEEIAFVLENRGVAHKDMQQKIEHYLQQVGLVFDNPHKPIKQLSQGQKQRLALASALALEPDTLVLDEPTALLDPVGTADIWRHVRQLAREKTLLIVEHKIEQVIDLVDRVLVLDENGALIADGTPDQIQQEYLAALNSYGIWHSESWSMHDKKYEVPSVTGSGQSTHTPPLLAIEELKGFYDEEACIKIPKLGVREGEWVTITGPNGAGKSTLLMALLQLIEADGTVRFNGRLLENTEQASSDIGFIFQNPELQFVAQSVYDEVAFTLQQEGVSDEEVHSRVKSILEQFGLWDQKEQNPFQLSTGQQRRLSVASSLVVDRKVLLLDEPTFGQDAGNTFAILRELERLRRQGIAILMVTHDPAIVQRYATRVWEIRDGVLQEDYPGKRNTDKTGRVHYAV